ncbi:MAG: amidohydrolase family protein [Pseudomonadota bacterium]|nr:amidohydrolase family protein [Pseudomonadota bacterium]
MSIAENADIENWIAQETPEEVLEPDLPIIDPHHHLWDLRNRNGMGFRQEVYLCEEISRDIADSGHNVVQTVFAQCGAFYRADGPEEMRPVGETEFVHGIAAMSRSGIYGPARLCTGIFSTVDLRLGDVAAGVLEAHLHASANFRGVRTAFPSDLNEEFLKGFALLEKYNLSYDNWSPDFSRLPRLADLANMFPGVTVIVNHLGGRIDPRADDEERAAWQVAIDAVAACPNAVMKLGGAQMRVGDWEPPYHMHQASSPWSSDEFLQTLLPRYQYALEAFGPDRCMFESNYPVDKDCISYRTLWNLFKKIAKELGLSDSEKRDVFSGTAARAYRLSTL